MTASSKEAIADRLAAARRRTFDLVEPLNDEQLNRVYSSLLSPLAWDLGHIANFEELWLVQKIGGREPLRGDLGRFYDAIENPRRDRADLPILRGAELRAYLSDVRERTLDALEGADISPDAPDPLLRYGFAYEMVIAHELQHNETMLQLLQMVDGYQLPGERAGATAGAELTGPAQLVSASDTIRIPAGTYEIGAPLPGDTIHIPAGTYEIGAAPPGAPAPAGLYEVTRPAGLPPGSPPQSTPAGMPPHPIPAHAPHPSFAYDNERPCHTVTLDSFDIDRLPVLNSTYAEFVADTGAKPPMYWSDDEEGWWYDSARGRWLPLDLRHPVMHLSWHEADAFARWAGARLPTEQEWEVAATTSGVSLLGIGQAWEWTASDFTAYPGFTPFPYREYSEVFFGNEYKVLRGGSWVTDRTLMRPTFRNWDLPQRRQIFAGIRLVRDTS